MTVNTDARDPILRGLDGVAGLADGDHIDDRMAGISRKARANRNRRLVAGAAGLAIVGAAATGAIELVPGGEATDEVSNTVTVTEPGLVVTDETSVDIDGDGRADQIQLMMPRAAGEQGHRGHRVAEVTRATGEKTEIRLFGAGVPTVGGTADLNGDGVREVEVVSDGADHSWWTVLTFTNGHVVAAKPILSGGEWIATPETGAMEHAYAGATYHDFQVTWMRDGQLVSWLALRAWDRKSDAKVTLSPWVLDRGELLLGGPQERVCVTPDPETWTNPRPC